MLAHRRTHYFQHYCELMCSQSCNHLHCSFSVRQNPFCHNFLLFLEVKQRKTVRWTENRGLQQPELKFREDRMGSLLCRLLQFLSTTSDGVFHSARCQWSCESFFSCAGFPVHILFTVRISFFLYIWTYFTKFIGSKNQESLGSTSFVGNKILLIVNPDTLFGSNLYFFIIKCTTP